MSNEEKFEIAFHDAREVNSQMTSGDGQFSDTVRVWHDDGSYFSFKFATLVELEVYGAQFICVHTEHNGANVFFKDDVRFKIEKQS